jgi:uncharacterized protein YcbX
MTAERQKIAQMEQTWVYPVKGMQGVQMDEVGVKSISVIGDRRVAFTETDTKGTPTLLDTTKFPGLLRYSPRFENPLDPKNSKIIVTTPQGTEEFVDSPVLLEQVSDESGKKLAVLRMGRGAYHSMPASLMSLGSVRQTEEQAGTSVDPRVFRQNLYIETTSGLPYEEDQWLGKLLVFGDEPDSAKLVAVKLDHRCATVNYHPETGATNPKILRAIVQNHNETLGIYCTIVGEGKIRADSPVYLSALSL